MKSREIETIYDCLAPYGTKGCGYLSLSTKTGIQPSVLHGYLKKHKEIFSQVGKSSTYKLKTGGVFDGSKESMFAVLKSNRRYEYFTGAVIILGLTFTFYNIFDQGFIDYISKYLF